ncbi:hypothetical protein K470DRAFT_260919 [Piedraia hortae CBS 480.64]|uniref:Tetratricopeptide repeat domain-containing protein n=1 Tax=Piedraia hortae CBS 480.64 TaxID=1314780 RepID=A0A6A7BS53_9PEZI|nr:hypothetical protein K470DRAFT_260919 [Piedraia hortae CBS 480.64]
MPYVKPTVHLSRLAGSALKSFTHGYAQTLVAASQNSNFPQNNGLADTLSHRIRRAERNRLQNGSLLGEVARQDTGVPDPALEKYVDALQKSLKSGKLLPQLPLVKRQRPALPSVEAQTETEEVLDHLVEAEKQLEHLARAEPVAKLELPSLTRSYTTSALDDFDKALGDGRTKEAVVKQVSEAMVEEVAAVQEAAAAGETAPAETAEATSTAEIFTRELINFAELQQYERIPPAFQAMLLSGVKQPPAAAYRALLLSSIHTTLGKHEKVPAALKIYTDMLHRNVVPDEETFGMLIHLLSRRSLDCMDMLKDVEQRRLRFGGFDRPESFMFASTEAEHKMLSEDSSLKMALKLFGRATKHGVVPAVDCAALIITCANHGRIADMETVYAYLKAQNSEPLTYIYPSMIAAMGWLGDLKTAVDLYNEYKELAIAHTAGKNNIMRIDEHVYGAMMSAYGLAKHPEKGERFMSRIKNDYPSEYFAKLRDYLTTRVFIPRALSQGQYREAMGLAASIKGSASTRAMADVATAAADNNVHDVAVEAYDVAVAPYKEGQTKLSKTTDNTLAQPAMSLMAMHVRGAKVEAATPYFTHLKAFPPQPASIESAAMMAIGLIAEHQAECGVAEAREEFARSRGHASELALFDVVRRIDEALYTIGDFMLCREKQPAAAFVELLAAMSENGGVHSHIKMHIMARFGEGEIAQLGPEAVELLLRLQSDMIVHEFAMDVAATHRLASLIKAATSISLTSSPQTMAAIDKALTVVGHPDLYVLWDQYLAQRRPLAPSLQPVPAATPYGEPEDVIGSNAIIDMLGHQPRLNDAMDQLNAMRRSGKAPSLQAYLRLVEVATKSDRLDLAQDIYAMARNDIPITSTHDVSRFRWQQLMDHLVAASLLSNRRDLAAMYHQQMFAIGLAPSANTFGLYITTLKAGPKTFDEASEAVDIFMTAQAEGVEPTSFLYNALIGKLGKARRIDDCLIYFDDMRNRGIRPTSVTYGTIVNALCRVSDQTYAEEIFDEMENARNYKPRPAPYHSMMQFFITIKRDRTKAMAYYRRMLHQGIKPTAHTFRLLIDIHATMEPINMSAAESVLDDIKAAGLQPGAIHYAALIHAKGCDLHDLPSARALFDSVVTSQPHPALYQALFESMNANHSIKASDEVVKDMEIRSVEFTPYIANALITGWSQEQNITKAREAYERVPVSKREPSTYEAMVRAYLADGNNISARRVVREALSRGYPKAVAGKIADLVR